MKNLDGFLEATPDQLAETVEIDVSQMIGEPPKTTIFTFQNPTATQVFQAGSDGIKLGAMFPDMTTEMGTVVALMALAHVSPASQLPKGVLYARLAIKNGKFFLWLLNEFFKAFPHLKDAEAQIKATKKLSSVE